MIENPLNTSNEKIAATRPAVRRILRGGRIALLGAAVVLSSLTWLLVTFLAEDVGRLRNDFGKVGRVRLMVIEGHGRFAVCRAPSTLRYLDRAFSGHVSAAGALSARHPADLTYERWRSDRRPWDYDAEIFFDSGAVYSGPICLILRRQYLLIGLPAAGLVWTQPYRFVGPRDPPRSIKNLAAFLWVSSRSLAGETARTF